MIDAHHVVAEIFVNFIQRAADRRARKMPDVERLCDIDGRVVDHDRFAHAGIRPPPVFSCLFQRRKHAFRIKIPVIKKIEISARSLRARHERRRFKLSGELLRDDGRRLPQLLCQLEAGQGRISHFRVGGRFQQPCDLRRFHTRRFCYRFRKRGFKIHFHSSECRFYNSFDRSL